MLIQIIHKSFGLQFVILQLFHFSNLPFPTLWNLNIKTPNCLLEICDFKNLQFLLILRFKVVNPFRKPSPLF